MWICSDRRTLRLSTTEATQGRSWHDSSRDVKTSSPNNPTELNRMPQIREEVNASGSDCCELGEEMRGEILKANRRFLESVSTPKVTEPQDFAQVHSV